MEHILGGAVYIQRSLNIQLAGECSLAVRGFRRSIVVKWKLESWFSSVFFFTVSFCLILLTHVFPFQLNILLSKMQIWYWGLSHLVTTLSCCIIIIFLKKQFSLKYLFSLCFSFVNFFGLCYNYSNIKQSIILHSIE